MQMARRDVQRGADQLIREIGIGPGHAASVEGGCGKTACDFSPSVYLYLPQHLHRCRAAGAGFCTLAGIIQGSMYRLGIENKFGRANQARIGIRACRFC
ncbi:hypothetical protein GCM10007928_40440 [Sulfitobacter porphyrae]|nr:hypothetical protein GCM10007928_40440 [Sulfitobacter porphyrae]